jgi:hypothetical protein
VTISVREWMPLGLNSTQEACSSVDEVIRAYATARCPARQRRKGKDRSHS